MTSTREEEEKLATAAIAAEEERATASIQVAEITLEENTRLSAKNFYDNLHGMIKYAEENNVSDVVSYSLSGKGITIHNLNKFTEVDGILKKFFGEHMTHDRFSRRLRDWYFKYVRGSTRYHRDNLTYVHPFFERKNSDSFYHINQTRQVRREKRKAKTRQNKSSTDFDESAVSKVMEGDGGDERVTSMIERMASTQAREGPPQVPPPHHRFIPICLNTP